MGSHLPVVARRLAGWAAMPLGPGEGVAPMLFSKLFHLEREIGQVDISFSFNYILFVNVFFMPSLSSPKFQKGRLSSSEIHLNILKIIPSICQHYLSREVGI